MKTARLFAAITAIAGGVLLAASILISNTTLEQAFGRAPHSLAWGTTLFRILLGLHGIFLLYSPFAFRSDRPTAWHPIRGRSLAILIGLTVLATVLRIPGLNSCMWLDEVLTMVRFARPPVAQILTSFPDQNQHMLYSLLAHGSMRLFGEQVWALRLASVLLGIGSIWTLFLIGRRLMGETEALLACALMTVSYHHIWFSQNARGYMGLLFFTNLATWLWLEAMDRNTLRPWIAYAVSFALGTWIHMTMFFVVAAHALISFVVWLRSDRDRALLQRATMAFFIGGTLVLQLHALVLPEFFRTAVSEVSMPSEWTNPFWVIKESIRSLQVGFAALAVVFAGGFLIVAGWVDFLRRQPRAAWAMVLPAILGGGSMLALGHNLWPRFFFFCMGFALLIVVHGAMQAPRFLQIIPLFRSDWASRAGYALTGLMIVMSTITIPRCYALPKQDFTGARAYVEQLRQPGDVVVVVGLAEHAYASYYAPSWNVAHSPDELAALHANAARTFLVYTLPIELRAFHPELWKAVETGFETKRVFWGTLGGGEVYVCRERNRMGQLRVESR